MITLIIALSNSNLDKFFKSMWIVNLAPRIVDACQSTGSWLDQIHLSHLHNPKSMIIMKPWGWSIKELSCWLKWKRKTIAGSNLVWAFSEAWELSVDPDIIALVNRKPIIEIYWIAPRMLTKNKMWKLKLNQKWKSNFIKVI